MLFAGVPDETRTFLLAFSGVRQWRRGVLEMLYSAAAFDRDGSGVAALGGQGAGSSADPQVKAVAAVYEWELDRAERFRPMWAEHQTVVARL